MENSEATQQTKGDVVIQVTIREYLTALEANEGKKPPAMRREVPSITELAEAAGVSRATMYNLAGNYVQSVNLQVLSTILSELRKRGFEAELTDLLTVYPAELMEA